MRDIEKHCKELANKIRVDCINATYAVGNTGAHIGGTLSLCEIMAVLYGGVMRYNVNDTHWAGRDRLILSKGHGVLAQYAALKEIGVISEEDFSAFKKNETKLYAHPSRNLNIGIEFSSGSLGQGVSLGVGLALALHKKSSTSKVFVIVGDGECDEGSVWEAAMSASHFKLSNFTLIIDRNVLQYDGDTEQVMSLGDLSDKFRSFGLETFDIDGHNVPALIDAFDVVCDKPKAVIANTVKGKGVSFMEGNSLWHNNKLTEEQYKLALKEQEENNA